MNMSQDKIYEIGTKLEKKANGIRTAKQPVSIKDVAVSIKVRKIISKVFAARIK